MEKIITVKDVVDKINSKDQSTPESILSEIIELMKIYSMDKKEMSINGLFLITQNGKISDIPISTSMAHGPLGEMLIKTYVKDITKKLEVESNSIVEFNFAHGIVAKVEEADSKTIEKYLKISKAFLKGGSDAIQDEPDFKDYFVVNVLDKEKAITKIYDVITSVDKSGKTIPGEPFVIARTPMIEKELEYDNEKLINYFKD